MRIVKFFAAFLVICMFTFFATANMHSVQLHIFTKAQSLIGYNTQSLDSEGPKIPRSVPVFAIVYGSFALGFMCFWLLSMGMNRSHKKKIKLFNRKIKEQEKELDSLRNLPVSDSPVHEDVEASLPIPEK